MGNPQYIQDAVDNFEDLYGDELTEQQQQNLVEAFEYGEVSLGIDVDLATDALMAWGVHTWLTNDMLEDRQVIERLLFDYDGDHEDLDEYIRELYFLYFDINDKQALRSIDTVSFKDELECQGYCFAPSLDGTVYHVFND